MDIRPEVVGEQAKRAGLSFWQHNKSHIITVLVTVAIVSFFAVRWLR